MPSITLDGLILAFLKERYKQSFIGYWPPQDYERDHLTQIRLTRTTEASVDPIIAILPYYEWQNNIGALFVTRMIGEGLKRGHPQKGIWKVHPLLKPVNTKYFDHLAGIIDDLLPKLAEEFK